MKQPDHGVDRARSMRKNMSPAETLLWRAVRSRQLCGLKFRRQVWIGNYITDFVALDAKIVIEIDGDSHAGREAHDARRTAYLESQDFRVLRFTNSDVLTNLEGVLLVITAAIPSPGAVPAPPSPLKGEGHEQPSPSPLGGEGRGEGCPSNDCGITAA